MFPIFITKKETEHLSGHPESTSAYPILEKQINKEAEMRICNCAELPNCKLQNENICHSCMHVSELHSGGTLHRCVAIIDSFTRCGCKLAKTTEKCIECKHSGSLHLHNALSPTLGCMEKIIITSEKINDEYLYNVIGAKQLSLARKLLGESK